MRRKFPNEHACFQIILHPGVLVRAVESYRREHSPRQHSPCFWGEEQKSAWALARRHHSEAITKHVTPYASTTMSRRIKQSDSILEGFKPQNIFKFFQCLLPRVELSIDIPCRKPWNVCCLTHSDLIVLASIRARRAVDGRCRHNGMGVLQWKARGKLWKKDNGAKSGEQGIMRG